MSDSLHDLSVSLLTGLRAGDPQAAELVTTLFRPALLRFCLGYLGSVEEAEDAVQDVFAKVLQNSQVPDKPRV